MNELQRELIRAAVYFEVGLLAGIFIQAKVINNLIDKGELVWKDEDPSFIKMSKYLDQLLKEKA